MVEEDKLMSLMVADTVTSGVHTSEGGSSMLNKYFCADISYFCFAMSWICHVVFICICGFVETIEKAAR